MGRDADISGCCTTAQTPFRSFSTDTSFVTITKPITSSLIRANSPALAAKPSACTETLFGPPASSCGPIPGASSGAMSSGITPEPNSNRPASKPTLKSSPDCLSVVVRPSTPLSIRSLRSIDNIFRNPDFWFGPLPSLAWFTLAENE